MSKTTQVTVTLLIVTLLLAAVRVPTSSATDTEAAIKALEHDLGVAVRHKDLDRLMGHYTVSENLVVFDVTPPRQFTGWEAYKEQWRSALAACKDSPVFEIKDLSVYGGAGYAFSHSIQHFACTNQQDKKVDLLLRVTDGYANFKGTWLIAHEHISVPVDLATGKADLETKP